MASTYTKTTKIATIAALSFSLAFPLVGGVSESAWAQDEYYGNTGIYPDDEDHYVPSRDNCAVSAELASTSDGRNDSAPGTGSDSTSVGAWNVEGSDENKVAWHMFDYMTKEVGMSGAFAVGMIANSYYESGLIPDRSQGAGVIRFGMNSKTPPANEGGGGGLFQFTPYTNFTESEYWGKINDEGWGVDNQIAFALDTQFKTGDVALYAFSTNPQYGAAHYGRTPVFSSLEEWYTTDDPAKAAEAFLVGYERPAQFHPERLTMAQEMNDYFNKDRVEADVDKITEFMGGSLDGGSSGFSDLSSSSASSSSDSGAVDCSADSEDNREGGSIPEDASGDHELGDLGSSWGKFYRQDELPDHLKKYALDPESLGINYGDCSNWTKFTNTGDPMLNGQCVALSKAIFGTYWQKDGKSPAGFLCNGNVCSEAASEANGGTDERTPRAGAIAQQKLPGPYGHTYIVSHVFENGDILLIEQNVDGYSGWNNGEVCNWNWRVQSKAGYESFDSSFYVPTKEGYEVNPDVRTLAKE